MKKIYGLDNKEYIYFEDENIGIIIYHERLKQVTFYKHPKTETAATWKMDLILKISNIDKKEIFKKIYENLPTGKLKKSLSSRKNGVVNKTSSFYVGIESNKIIDFANIKEKEYLKFFGFKDENIIKIKAKVIKSFSSKSELSKEKDNLIDNLCFYGFWNIKKDFIRSVHLDKKISNIESAFPDFGKSLLEDGGLFLKFKLIKD